LFSGERLQERCSEVAEAEMWRECVARTVEVGRCAGPEPFADQACEHGRYERGYVGGDVEVWVVEEGGDEVEHLFEREEGFEVVRNFLGNELHEIGD